MRKFLLRLLYGDPIKVAKIVLPIGVLLAISLVYSDNAKYAWNVEQTILISLIVIVFAAFGYTQVKPPKPGEDF